jgi:hypothetical protein
MAADVLQYAIGNSASTTGSSSINNTDTSLPLTSDTNFAAKSGEGMVLIDEGEATEELSYSTSKAGATLAIPLANRGLEGGSPQAHSSGATVKGILTAGMWNNLIDALINVVSKSTGAVDTTKVVTLTGTQVLTNKTLTSPVINTASGAGLTSPKITTGINDSGNNELLKVTAIGSAINELTLANAAAGGSPVLSATGDDSNIGLDLKMKGTGVFRKPSTIGIQVFDSADSTATGDGKAFFRVPMGLNGMNLTGVNMTVYTAGTTGTTDVQIRNKTDSVDMLSTKLTIDSGETDTSTAATPAVIDTSKDDVATGDVLCIDVDAVHSGTAAKGLYVELRFELP